MAMCLALASCDKEPARAPWARTVELAHDSDLDRLLSSELPGLVIALNAADHAAYLDEVMVAAQAMRSRCPKRWPQVCARLRELSAALFVAYHAPESATTLAWRQLARTKRALNRSFAESSAGYYVDTAALILDGERLALALSFSVRAVRQFRAGQQVVPVLLVERRDGLNWSYEVLGFAGDSMDEAIVQVDVVDREIFSEVCPAIDSAGPEPAGGTYRSTLRSELSLIDGIDELGALCRQRHQGWERLRTQVRLRSPYELGEASGLTLSGEEQATAEQVLSASEVAELRAVDSKLGSHPALVGVREHMLRRVAVHEAQHHIDLGRDLAAPAGLAADTSAASTDDVAAEVSAYLAEMAHVPASARSSLARLLDISRSPERQGSTEQQAAAFIVSGLEGSVDASRAGDDIANAARELWRRTFGRELRAIVEL